MVVNVCYNALKLSFGGLVSAMDSTSPTVTAHQAAASSRGTYSTSEPITKAAHPDCSGLMIVLVGPAGVGKNTIMQRAIAALPRLSQMPTATTRAPRENEKHGREHWFVSLEEFQAMIAAGDLLEYQEVHPGRFYGTPRNQIFQALRHDHAWLVADIDIAGAAALRKLFPESAVLIFIEPPDMDTLSARMHNRGQATEAEIKERLARVPREMAFAAECDYRVLNGSLDDAVTQVIAIILAEAERHHCA